MVRARALWLTGPRAAEIRSEDVAPPGEGEVVVQALASAISHGTEMLVYRGEVHADLALDLPSLRGGFGFPIKYGYASVGRVAQVGAGVAGLRSGQMVFAYHPHQDVYVASASAVVPLADEVDAQTGCFLANVETALNVLLDAPLRLGETALILGQGVVGLLLNQLAQRAGARRVIAVDAFPIRRELARRLGAWAVLEPGDAVHDTVMAATNGRGADLVIEASGSPAGLQTALACAAFQGTVVACSWYGTKQVTLDLGRDFHRRRLRLISSQVSTVDPALGPRWDRARRAATAVDLLVQLRINELITHRIPFEDAAGAYELIDQRPDETVQVVLTYGSADV